LTNINVSNYSQVVHIKQFSNVKCNVLQILTPLQESIVPSIFVPSVISDYSVVVYKQIYKILQPMLRLSTRSSVC